MVNIWFIAGGAFAALAAALLAVRRRNHRRPESSGAVGPVSEEWLANARGQADQGW
jgi:LPXTG-motif cell wall-anchored protein